MAASDFSTQSTRVDRSTDDRGAPGRLLAVGDIHGCHAALDSLLDRLCVTERDTVVVLGDVIDRGPGTRRAIDRLIELRDRCRLVFIKGNHEEIYLETLDDPHVLEEWLAFGGLETLQSYGDDAVRLPSEHADFLRTAVDFYETPSTVFVHASLEPGVPLAEQTGDWLRWAKLTKAERPLPSGQRVVCGHTPQKDGRPWVGDGWICIDTFAYGGQCLTALDLGGDLVYQARSGGECRGPTPLAEFADH